MALHLDTQRKLILVILAVVAIAFAWIGIEQGPDEAQFVNSTV